MKKAHNTRDELDEINRINPKTDLPSYFSDEQFQVINKILKPPSDFNLHERLTKAVKIYRALCRLDRHEPQRKDKVANIEIMIKRIDEFNVFLNEEEHENTFLQLLDGDSSKHEALKKIITKLCIDARILKKELPIAKRGRKYNYGMRVFCKELINIYESATEKVVTAKWDPYKQDPYGEDFEFIFACMDLINVNLGRETILNCIKDTLQLFNEFESNLESRNLTL